ncbi:hypothetical protein [Streptomyces sp. NPDC059122]|uniref:hypothetical protein n=1 Tax=Streptomyces sp. NPDC059122 TaxID=3346732 RepID=UPI003673DEAE
MNRIRPSQLRHDLPRLLTIHLRLHPRTALPFGHHVREIHDIRGPVPLSGMIIQVRRPAPRIHPRLLRFRRRCRRVLVVPLRGLRSDRVRPLHRLLSALSGRQLRVTEQPAILRRGRVARLATLRSHVQLRQLLCAEQRLLGHDRSG